MKPLRLLVWAALAMRPAFASDAAGLFESRIRPLFIKSCHACHADARQGGLRLDSLQTLLKGGDSGPAIVPGKPEESLLIRVLSHSHERLKMPPQGKLGQEEIEAVASWIRAGAVWPEGAPQLASGFTITPQHRAFWAFQPVRKPSPPKVKDAGWPKSPIDAFILAALEAKGLSPAPAAGKRALLRRSTYDLTGLPPTPGEMQAFLKDRSPGAYEKALDRLLASPGYGERWGRYWLDVARYSDDKLNSVMDEPYPNAFRYRDWVIQAFNQDLPWDLFVKAQLAGDLIRPPLPAGLGLYGLSPEFQDDRIDVTTRGFLGLTVACAQCHDHKYDPISTKDYYSLLGVFNSSEIHQVPVAPEDVVSAWDRQKKQIDQQEAALKVFLQSQGAQLAEILAQKTAAYLVAARGGPADGLDRETLGRWKRYLKKQDQEHPFLKAWFALPPEAPASRVEQGAAEFEERVLALIAEKNRIDEHNKITLGIDPDRGALARASLQSLERDKYILWRDLFEEKRGIYHYGDQEIDCFLSGHWKEHLNALRGTLARLKAALPPQYPFLHALRDKPQPANEKVHLRGDRENLGEEAPRRFLSILSKGEPAPFQKGSGRLELAEAIASPENPLTARVIANRVWLHHFGQGIVRTPGNFGFLGDRPSHPELLDYLATRLIENRWSLKALHREIMLSRVYRLDSGALAQNSAVDPDNRLFWRANRRRLDAEALRDSLLFVSGELDLEMGGPPPRFGDDNRRRTVYGFMSRRRPDATLALFDFPNPNSLSEQRLTTSVPLQRLFFMNSGFIGARARRLAARLRGHDRERLVQVHWLAFQREPEAGEIRLGLEFLSGGGSWPQYAQALLASNEFQFVE